MGIFDSISGFFTGQTAQDAAEKQAAGLRQAYGQASDLLGQGRGALTTNYTAGLQPFLSNYGTATAGTKSLTDALGITGDPAQITARFQNTPGYQFQLEQGNENVLRNASRTGQGNSGAVNLDLQKQGQGLANQTYQQYVQNLMPFLGAGSTAAGGIGTLYSGLGNQLAQNYGTQANAAYGTQAGIGNAEANAELAKNSGVANILGLGQNALKLATSAFGGFAEGGRPPVGQPAIVGEKGPEVFVPDRPGFVVPNWMLDRSPAPAAAPRPPNTLASILLQAMSPQGLTIPAR